MDEYMANSCAGLLTCPIPFVFSTDSAGLLGYQNLQAGQSFNPEFNISNINNFVNTNCTNDCGMMVLIGSDTIAALEVNSVENKFFGNQNITVVGRLLNFVNGSEELNTTQVVQWRYSPFNITLPNNTVSYDIFSSSFNQTNVQPYSQKNGTPIFNITTSSKVDGTDVTVCLNETLDPCLNITWANSFDGTNAFNLNDTAMCINVANITDNLLSTSSAGVYNFWDLNSCGTDAFQFLNYSLVWDSWCAGCVRVS